MSYKRIKPKLIHLDDLVRVCGLFTDNGLNNGYGCRSKSKRKGEPGRCFGFDCPLAIEAALIDFKKYDIDLYEEYKDKDDVFDLDSGWMVQESKI